MGPEFEKGDGRLRPSLQQRLPGAEGPPEGCTTAPRHAACGGPLPSSAEGPCVIFSRVRISVRSDGTDGTLHRALRRGIMSAKAGSGVSVMRSDLDASTSTEVDAHEAQWRAGVNRQARPDAPSQRRAASLAAAAKRRRIRT